MASGSVPVPENTPIQSPDIISITVIASPIQEDELPPNDNLPDDNEDLPSSPAPTRDNITIKLSCGRAEYHSKSDDYLTSIFPEVKMTSAPISEPPAANPSPPILETVETSNILSLPVHTSSEQDVLFLHRLLHHHQKMVKEFHVDWGSNIIISNSMSVFT